MKILYILKRDLDESGNRMLARHKASNQVTVVRIEEKSADELLDLVESHDKLIMW
ncbi:MAG: hypothetical protein M0Z75_01415 [Nitrospiraceae bacterium]|nr:hypothetical protein [Nitrospiraceae bacterium]